MQLTGVLILTLALSLLNSAQAGAIVNPHYEEHCRSCHLKLPEKATDGAVDYHFLAEDIDPTCMICHSDSCCTIAKPHESTHASGIDRWDEKKYGRPKKLPLSDGYITCVTCHFWRRSNNPAPQDYKLVRLVEIRSTGVQWTALCHDCHSEM
jgi:hypothetical protein